MKTQSRYVQRFAVCLCLAVCFHTAQGQTPTGPFTLSPSAGENGSIYPDCDVQVYGGEFTFDATPATEYYEVDTWIIDGVDEYCSDDSYTLYEISDDHTVKVLFKPIEYHLTSSSGPNGTINPNDDVWVLKGGSQNYTAHPHPGYMVDQWKIDEYTVEEETGESLTLSNIQKDTHVHVTFKLLPGHLITPIAGINGSIHPDEPFRVPDGTRTTIKAYPQEDYEVDTWYVLPWAVQEGGPSLTLHQVQKDETVRVTFKLKQYTLTASAGINGSISPAQTFSVAAGGIQTFTALPKLGYEVATWKVDGVFAQLGGDTLTLSDIHAHHTIEVSFNPLLTYSLGLIDFNSEEDFLNRVVHNNVVVPDPPEKTRLHVERIANDLDPKGLMVMHSLADEDGRLIPARAKGRFLGTPADEVLIRFRYLFSTSLPGTELQVLLSNVPVLLHPSDPLYQDHYVQVATIGLPPAEQAGSQDSGRWAVFEKTAHTEHLDLSKGLWVELVLIEPEVSNSAFIDDWSASIQCFGICLDITWDNLVDTQDFLKMIGECGRPAAGQQACSEGLFSEDGMVDSHDVSSWDWALGSDDATVNLCQIPLTGPDTASSMSSLRTFSHVGRSKKTGPYRTLSVLPDSLDGLWILGKRGGYMAEHKLQDRLYTFNAEGRFLTQSTPATDRGNNKILQDSAGTLYLLNFHEGLFAVEQPGQPLVPPGSDRLQDMNEPRYDQPATVYVGLQGRGAYGRPLLDAAVDGDVAYVAPAVVEPDGAEPYMAAAKLQLLADGAVPYRVVQIYDDPPLPGNNQRRAIRELELDSEGNVYVLNAHQLNESDKCWRYQPDGSRSQLELGRAGSESYCPSPTAMYVSETGVLYLASSLLNASDPDMSPIKCFSTRDSFALKQTIRVHGMQHIVSISEDPTTGNLLVVGFNMDDIPFFPNPHDPPFYVPILAVVEPDRSSAYGEDLRNTVSHDLALPLSAIWKK